MAYSQDVLDFVTKNHLGVISTVSETGEPQGSLVDYMGFVEEGVLVIYFISRLHSRKVKNLEHDPRVAFLVGFGPDARNVQIQGYAKALKTKEEVDHFFKKLEERPDLKQVYLGESHEPWTLLSVDYVGIRIEVVDLTWLHTNEHGQAIYDHMP